MIGTDKLRVVFDAGYIVGHLYKLVMDELVGLLLELVFVQAIRSMRYRQVFRLLIIFIFD